MSSTHSTTSTRKTRTIITHRQMANDLHTLRDEVSRFIGNYGHLFKVREPSRVAMMNIQSQLERLRRMLDNEYKMLNSTTTDIHIYYPIHSSPIQISGEDSFE